MLSADTFLLSQTIWPKIYTRLGRDENEVSIPLAWSSSTLSQCYPTGVDTVTFNYNMHGGTFFTSSLSLGIDERRFTVSAQVLQVFSSD